MNINRSHCPFLSFVHLFQRVGYQRVREMDKKVWIRETESQKVEQKWSQQREQRFNSIFHVKNDHQLHSSKYCSQSKSYQKVALLLNHKCCLLQYVQYCSGRKHINRISIAILKLWHHTQGSWIPLVTEISWRFGKCLWHWFPSPILYYQLLGHARTSTAYFFKSGHGGGVKKVEGLIALYIYFSVVYFSVDFFFY